MDSSGDPSKEGDDDESSSALNPEPELEPKSALDEFREKWQQELKKEALPSSPSRSSGSSSSSKDKPGRIDGGGGGGKKALFSDEQQARALFLQAADLERSGKVFEAMRFYRKAIQLVPDIEFKIYDKITTAADEQELNGLSASLIEASLEDELEDEENLENVDLEHRFQSLLLAKSSGKLFESASAADHRMLIVTSVHFSDLPMEVILYILRWVVSSELDLKSMERFARVCRGFYLLARDAEIWKRACVRVWGVNVGHLKGSPFANWREMYINRPRVHFHGCYISRTSYLRYGENSFQDQFYRPVQLVEYYRYFRFFADGRVLMMTSAEEPQNCVGKLKTRSPHQSEILVGHYRLHNDEVIIAVQRNRPSGQSQRPGRKKEIEVEAGQQTFYLELKIISKAKRSFSQLHWTQYSMVQLRDNEEKTTIFELAPNKYPPLYFSRVKSYHQESDGPLK